MYALKDKKRSNLKFVLPKVRLKETGSLKTKKNSTFLKKMPNLKQKVRLKETISVKF